MKNNLKIGIIGAGIQGVCSALFLQKKGHQVTLFDKDEPGKANLTVGSNWVGEQFKCIAYTIEMPFKDNILLPDYSVGWSDGRSSLFGRDVLTAIYQTVDHL